MSIYASTPQTTETLDQLGGGTGLAAILENVQDEFDTFSISTVDNLTITESASSSNYLAWGDDVKLYRGGENILVLEEGDEMYFVGSASGDALAKFWTQGNSGQSLEILADGKIQWGSGSGAPDTNLYRESASLLKTDDLFDCAGITSRDNINLYNNTDKIRFGDGTGSYDTELYRGAANTLATEDKLVVYNQIDSIKDSAGTASLQTWVTGNSNPSFKINADGDHIWGDGAGNDDTNLYRDSANTLKTDDAFVAGTSLAIASSSAMTDIKDEDDMASDSATALATQQSIKAYVDSGADGNMNFGDSMPSTSVRFRGYLSGNQSISSGVRATLEIDTEEIDTGNDFNTTTHKFTCPVDGFYFVSSVVNFNVNSDKDDLRVFFMLNSNEKSTCRKKANGSDLQSIQHATVFECDVADTISIEVVNNSNDDTIQGGTDHDANLAIHLLST